jgi:hypothetical protein
MSSRTCGSITPDRDPGARNPLSALRGHARSKQEAPSATCTPPQTTAQGAHLYDAPIPTARAFLLAVMHNRTTPLQIRVDAADKLLRIFGPDGFYPPRLTYQIPGLLQ